MKWVWPKLPNAKDYAFTYFIIMNVYLVSHPTASEALCVHEGVLSETLIIVLDCNFPKFYIYI